MNTKHRDMGHGDAVEVGREIREAEARGDNEGVDRLLRERARSQLAEEQTTSEEGVKRLARRRDHVATRPDVRNDDDVVSLVVRKGDETWHDGLGWYYWEEEYPDEGSCGSFDTSEEAVYHFREAGVPFKQVGGRGGNVVMTQQQDPTDRDDKLGNLTIRGGVGWGESPGGSIIFDLPDGAEAFRLDADGTVTESGERVATDRPMYEALWRWLRGEAPVEVIGSCPDCDADSNEQEEPQRARGAPTMMTYEQTIDVMQLLAADAGCAVTFTPLHVVPVDGNGPPDYHEGYRGSFGRIPWPARSRVERDEVDDWKNGGGGWPVEMVVVEVKL